MCEVRSVRGDNLIPHSDDRDLERGSKIEILIKLSIQLQQNGIPYRETITKSCSHDVNKCYQSWLYWLGANGS